MAISACACYTVFFYESDTERIYIICSGVYTPEEIFKRVKMTVLIFYLGVRFVRGNSGILLI